jgi:hypothetical protein
MSFPAEVAVQCDACHRSSWTQIARDIITLPFGWKAGHVEGRHYCPKCRAAEPEKIVECPFCGKAPSLSRTAGSAPLHRIACARSVDCWPDASVEALTLAVATKAWNHRSR